MIAIFDTNIVIDALNGIAKADDEYSRYERVLISRITWMEVVIGAEGNDAELRDFLETHFEIIPLDLAVAETAVQLRRAHHIRLKPDDTETYYNRAMLWEQEKKYSKAIADCQKYLELGGGVQDGNSKKVVNIIRKLKKKMK